MTVLRFPTGAELVGVMERALNGDAEVRPIAWVALLTELVESNLAQWKLEDITRDPSASDEVVAKAKRGIDRLNIGRHRLMEQVDALIAARLEQSPDAPLATESPGMVLDRLSVLVIRRFLTQSAAADQPGYSERLPQLDARIHALSLAFDSYIDDLHVGTRQFLPYEHLKLYRFGAADDPE